MDAYILDGTTPVLCENLIEWSQHFEKTNRRVAYTKIAEGVEISTVFLGLDHSWCSWSENKKPLLFETMVFWANNALDNRMERYSTWIEAEQGHEKMCECVREAIVIARNSQ